MESFKLFCLFGNSWDFCVDNAVRDSEVAPVEDYAHPGKTQEWTALCTEEEYYQFLDFVFQGQDQLVVENLETD